MNIQGLLNEEIRDEFEQLRKMELGTEQYEKTVNGLTKLLDKTIEMEKVDLEFDTKERQREADEAFREEQAKDEKKDRMVKNGLTIAQIVIPAGLAVWGTVKSIKFEQEGTITTLMGRGWINKLLPKK